MAGNHDKDSGIYSKCPGELCAGQEHSLPSVLKGTFWLLWDSLKRDRNGSGMVVRSSCSFIVRDQGGKGF